MTNEPQKALQKSERFVYFLFRSIWFGLDHLLPPTCGGCGKYGMRWCQECDLKVETLSPPCCPICGQKQKISSVCSRCNLIRPSYNQLRSWAVFKNEIRNAIHKLKYKNDISLGEILSRSLIKMLGELPWVIDIVVPVPLANDRMKERGYNQAALIAFPLALGTGLRYSSKALRRVRETESQVGLSLTERHENVLGAFVADVSIVRGKSILIVDDVATSGATLNACATALYTAGANEVYAITLARAMYNYVDGTEII